MLSRGRSGAAKVSTSSRSIITRTDNCLVSVRDRDRLVSSDVRVVGHFLIVFEAAVIGDFDNAIRARLNELVIVRRERARCL